MQVGTLAVQNWTSANDLFRLTIHFFNKSISSWARSFRIFLLAFLLMGLCIAFLRKCSVTSRTTEWFLSTMSPFMPQKARIIIKFLSAMPAMFPFLILLFIANTQNCFNKFEAASIFNECIEQPECFLNPFFSNCFVAMRGTKTNVAHFESKRLPQQLMLPGVP